LGVKLFDRSKRPLLLSEAGQLFLKLARDVLNETEDFERYVLELSTGIAGAVKIGRQHFGGHGKAFLQRESAVTARKA